MKSILISISIVISSGIYCQVDSDSMFRKDLLSNIGKAIKNFKDFKYSGNDYFGYIYVPAQKDSIVFSNVSFGKVQVTVNKHSRIKTVRYLKYYSDTSANYLNKVLSQDFGAVLSWLSEMYNAQYKTITPRGNANSYWDGAVWSIKKRKIKLTKTTGEWRGQDNQIKGYLELVFE